MKKRTETPKDLFLCKKGVNMRYERIKALMLDRGIRTIDELARKCGVSRSMVSQVMHLHAEPTTSLKIKIAQVLETDSRILFKEVEQ